MTASSLHLAPHGGDASVLDCARDALARQEAAAVDLLVAAAEWAERHPAPSPTEAAGWGERDLYGEGVVPLAGEGAPLVAEFAPMEFAAVLGWRHDAGRALIGEALELKHRLPRLWAWCSTAPSRSPSPVASPRSRWTSPPRQWCGPTG